MIRKREESWGKCEQVQCLASSILVAASETGVSSEWAALGVERNLLAFRRGGGWGEEARTPAQGNPSAMDAASPLPTYRSWSSRDGRMCIDPKSPHALSGVSKVC